MNPEDLAKQIAECANDCCHRSDGYKEDVMKVALDYLKSFGNQRYKEGAEDSAKFLEENGWLDTIPTEVNMKKIAFRYARAIRNLIKEKDFG